jgi:hypothetical protein
VGRRLRNALRSLGGECYHDWETDVFKELPSLVKSFKEATGKGNTEVRVTRLANIAQATACSAPFCNARKADHERFFKAMPNRGRSISCGSPGRVPTRARMKTSSTMRPALGNETYAGACAANRASSSIRLSISRQAFGILAKLREVDAAMTPALQARVAEVHPELSFFAMGGRPAKHGKRASVGRAERLRILTAAGFPSIPTSVTGAAPDDVLDAVAACWSAQRIHLGTSVGLPEGPVPVDARGLRMEIQR